MTEDERWARAERMLLDLYVATVPLAGTITGDPLAGARARNRLRVLADEIWSEGRVAQGG